MAAKFEAEGMFRIRGRGLVVVGRIIEGRVKVGMTFSLQPIPGELTILALEWPILHDENGEKVRGRVGLLFSLGGDQENSAWKDLDVGGRLIEINEPQ